MPSVLNNTHTQPHIASRPARIFTTFRRAKSRYNSVAAHVDILSLPADCSLWTLIKCYVTSHPSDFFVFNGDARLVTIASILKRVLPGQHGKIIATDLVLRIPTSAKARLAAQLRRWLWREVDLFIHYFKDWSGFYQHYGIDRRKSAYVPFKSNLYPEACQLAPHLSPASGDYIFSAGRSLRDYQTLVEAARISGLPVAILFTSKADWAAHGTTLDTTELPENVTLIQDSGEKAGWLQGLKNARLVVVPTKPESICASGIGTYLDAMALAKPVILTRGPGADDVLDPSLARFVAPEDPQALANEMRRLWDNPHAARQQGENGRHYALQLGDEQALLTRVFQCVMQHSQRIQR